MIKSNTSHIGFEDTKCAMGVEAALWQPYFLLRSIHICTRLKQRVIVWEQAGLEPPPEPDGPARWPSAVDQPGWPEPEPEPEPENIRWKVLAERTVTEQEASLQKNKQIGKIKKGAIISELDTGWDPKKKKHRKFVAYIHSIDGSVMRGWISMTKGAKDQTPALERYHCAASSLVHAPGIAEPEVRTLPKAFCV